MDDILASIRRIIDEEPVEPRHRAPLSEADGRREAAASVEPLGFYKTSERSDTGDAVQAAPPTRADAGVDDVLAELLEPAAPLVNIQPATPMATDTAYSSQPIAQPPPAPEVPAAAELSDASVGEMTPVSPQSTVPPAEVLPSAEQVMAELARGLSFAAPDAAYDDAAGAAPETVFVDSADSDPPAAASIVIDTSVDTDSGPSPAEAVAAAVAAVAAVNAVALLGGGRPRAAGIETASLADEPVIAATAADTTAPITSALHAAQAPEFCVAGTMVQPEITAHSEAPQSSLAEPLAEPLAETATAPAPVTSTDLVPQPPVTFEDAISTMLRPLLRDWLDDNMPRMVEKALKEELAVAGGLLVHTAKLAKPDAANPKIHTE